MAVTPGPQNYGHCSAPYCHVIKFWAHCNLPVYITVGLLQLPLSASPSPFSAILAVLHSLAFSPLLALPPQLTVTLFFLPLLIRHPASPHCCCCPHQDCFLRLCWPLVQIPFELLTGMAVPANTGQQG